MIVAQLDYKQFLSLTRESAAREHVPVLYERVLGSDSIKRIEMELEGYSPHKCRRP